MRLLLAPVTVIDCIKDPPTVVLMVKLPTTTTTTSAELTLSSLLPRNWVVPWSMIDVTRKGSKVFAVASTALELTFIMSGVKVTMDFMLTLVGVARHSFRLSVVKLSC